MTSHKLYSVAARLLALAMAGWTAAFVLWSPSSLAARVAGDSEASYILNALIVGCCAFGLLDIVWHDIRGELIWPAFPSHHRHHVCVLLYSLLAGLTGMRAFVAVGSDEASVVALGAYYLMCAVGIGTIAVALALETRHG